MGQGRLFKIVYHLLDKGRTTAPELAEKFEVSVRTIYRDLDAISAAGIPIYTVQGKGGGIFILPEFVLEKSLLTPQDAAGKRANFDGTAGPCRRGRQPDR